LLKVAELDVDVVDAGVEVVEVDNVVPLAVAWTSTLLEAGVVEELEALVVGTVLEELETVELDTVELVVGTVLEELETVELVLEVVLEATVEELEDEELAPLKT